MFTRGGERTQRTFRYRQALCSAMRVYLTAPFFRRWCVAMPYRGIGGPDGRCAIWFFRGC
jgi:hypothetical protein